LLRVAEVRQDDPRAKARIAELIQTARAAVAHLQARQADLNGNAVIEATSKASRAAGFLEACALIYPLMAGDMLKDFESLAAMVDRLPAGRQSTSAAGPDRRQATREGEPPRRIAVRRIVPERRVNVRRQLGDRRGW
jgi:hypothetical protein